MDLNYNDDQISTLYQKWARFGWMVSVPVYKGLVDLEDLIIETTWAARHDGRLMKWLMTWFMYFGDLVNKKRLLRLIEHADTAVLGVVIDIAMNNGADQNYKTIIQKCHPNKPVEVFNKSMKGVTIYEMEQIKLGKPQFRKWGFYCTMVEFYTDSIRSRDWIFRHNRFLAIRALFGVNIRSEILNLLDQENGLAIKKISKGTGYAYSGVYREVENLLINGLIKEDRGKGRILTLSNRMNNILKSAA